MRKQTCVTSVERLALAASFTAPGMVAPQIAVQNGDENNYGPGIDGLLGMSFLSRFEVQIAGNFVEVRTRRQKGP